MVRRGQLKIEQERWPNLETSNATDVYDDDSIIPYDDPKEQRESDEEFACELRDGTISGTGEQLLEMRRMPNERAN